MSMCRWASQVGYEMAIIRYDDTGSHERSRHREQEYGRPFSFLMATELAPRHADCERPTCMVTENIVVQLGFEIGEDCGLHKGMRSVVSGRPGQGGAPSANWEVVPNVFLARGANTSR